MENKSPNSSRVQRTTAQIKEILERFEQSGQSGTVFARENGLAFSTLMGWRLKVRKAHNGPPKFVELDPLSTVASGHSVAQIRFADGLSMDLHVGFTAQPVAQLIRLLRAP